MRLQTALHGLPRRERGPRRRADRAGRPLRGRRPQGGRLLGRDETPARPRARARPRPARPLPRRADDRARPAEPRRALGRGRPPRRRGGGDRFPHDPVPGGGRPLADRVGIIDDGKIVAEGTPAALKDEIGRPSLEVTPCKPRRGRPGARGPGAIRRARCPAPATRWRFAAGRQPRSSPTSSGRSTPRECGSRARDPLPDLDDVFLEKTGRRLEGAGDDGEMPTEGTAARGGRLRGAARRSAVSTRAAGRSDPPPPDRLPRRPRRAPHPAPAGDDRPQPRLPRSSCSR